MSKLSISLNKPGTGSVYMPGETLVGVVVADMNEPILYLNICIEGRAEVRIVELCEYTNEDGHKRNYEDVFTAEEICLSSKIPLLLFQSTLPKGRTEFPFEYTLPHTSLPCSFEAAHGSISYKIEVHLERPHSSVEIHKAIHFIVGPFLDLNTIRLNEAYRQSQFKQEQPVKGCCSSCFGSSGVIRLEMVLPKRLFVPGEYIQFQMTLDNQSRGTLLESGAMKVVLLVTCTAEGSSRVDETVLGLIAGPEVKPGCVQEWSVDNLWIPLNEPDLRIPPSGLGGCNIIHAQYILEYSAGFREGCGRGSIRLFVPLVVGTVAFKDKESLDITN